MSKSRIRKAVIPVAGLGTRFLPITKAIPKEMLPIVDRPVIEYIVDEALQSGIEQIILVTSQSKSSIEDYFDTNYELEATLRSRQKFEALEKVEAISQKANICSVRQKKALGLGHAVLCAKPFIGNEPFAVLLGDDVIRTGGIQKPGIRQLIDCFEQSGVSQVALMKVPKNEICLYGAAECVKSKFGASQLQITKLVEKPPPGEEKTDMAVIGRYVLQPSIWEILDKQVPGKGGEIQLTDALERLKNQSGLMGCCFDGERIDAGERLGYLKLNIIEALERKELKSQLEDYLKKL